MIGRTRKSLNAALTAAVVMATATGSVLWAGDAQAKKKRMTCTFIAKQCVRECSKEVSRGFCQDFCGMERQNCLATGTWETMGRKFTRVIKK